MRTLVLAGLLLMAGLAGCAGSDSGTTSTTSAPTSTPHFPVVHQADGRIMASSAYPGELPVFQELFVSDRGAGEPTIAISRDGTAIFPAIAFDVANGNAASTRVMASTDGGHTWVDRTPAIAGAVKAAPTSLDPYVYADPVTGRLFNIDLNLALGGFLSYSDDGGRSWTNNPGCCGLPVDDHQSLFSGPATTLRPVSPLYPRILYFCINQIGATSCTHSLDGGLTWSSGTPAYPGAEAPSEGSQGGVCGGLSGHGHASEKTGTVFVPKGQCGRPEVARSTDNGVTFSQVVIDNTFGIDGHEAIVSTDANGTVYYFYLDEKTLPRLAVSHDDGVTWGPAMNVTLPGVTTAKFPSIVAGAGGRIAFLYLGSTVPSGMRYTEAAHKAELENATWNAYVGYSLDADSDDPVFATTMAHDPADPLKRGSCAGRCFGNSGGMYDFLDIDIHPQTGQVWAALVDLCNEDVPTNLPACNGPEGTFRSYQKSRGAVGVQVGGTLLGSALP